MILVVFDILHKLAQLLVKRSLYLLLIAACVSLNTRGPIVEIRYLVSLETYLELCIGTVSQTLS